MNSILKGCSYLGHIGIVYNCLIIKLLFNY